MNGVIIINGEVILLSEAMQRFLEREKKEKEDKRNESLSH